MKLLFAHNDYGRPSGEEHAINSAARILESEGHQIDWLRKSSESLMRGGLHQIGAFFSGIHSPAARREMKHQLDQNDYDLVHVQNLFPFLSPSILAPAKQRGLPIVMRCPNYRMLCPTGLHLSKGEVCERCVGGKEWSCVTRNCEENLAKSVGYALRHAVARKTRSILDNVTIFIVLSKFQKRKFIAGGVPAEKIQILHNFTRMSDDLPVSHQSPTDPYVAFLGRPAKEKGIELFIEAARALPEVPFKVAGALESLPEMKQPVPANVEFTGFLAGDDLQQFLARMRMLVVPSQWFEGFPNTILDAMKHQKPVVASRIGSLPEIVRDGQTGLIFDHDSLPQLIDKIRTLGDDPQLCRTFGEEAREIVEADYSEGAFYRRLLEIYEIAIKRAANV